MRTILGVVAFSVGCAQSPAVVEPHQPAGPPGVIAGVVHQGNGTPLGGATIVALGDPQVTAMSDDHGAFRLEQVTAGAHRIVVYYDNAAYELGRVRPNTEVDLEVTLGMHHLDSGIVKVPSAVGATSTTSAKDLALHGTDVGFQSGRR